MRTIFLFLLILIPCSLLAQTDCANEKIPKLNKEIVKYTLSKVGKKVDRGECWDLARFALEKAECEWDHFEMYGELIDSTENCILPGDILQYENIVLKYEKDGYTYTENMVHHTSIVVERVEDRVIKIAHQNTMQTGRKVGVNEFDLDSIQSGILLIYRPTK